MSPDDVHSREAATPRKKRVFATALVLLAYLCVEAVSFGAYYALERRAMSPSRLQFQRGLIEAAEAPASDLESSGRRKRMTGLALHPYTGYVREPGSFLRSYPGVMNDQGYPGEHSLSSIEPDDFVVVITGGSVAARTFIANRDTLEDELGRLEGVAPDRIKLICLAMSGFKQPQSLMAVVYFLSQGGRIDLLINLDGFNEVTLLVGGLHPSYPRNWPQLIADSVTGEKVEVAAQIASLRAAAYRTARGFSWLRFSATANLLWTLRNRALNVEIAELNAQLESISDSGLVDASFSQVGPEQSEEAVLLDDGVEIWAASSLQLARLAGANGFAYFQFLQPNQYLEGTKTTFTSEEQRKALNRPQRWSGPANQGYTQLRARAEWLRQNGVDFTDLTGIYKDVARTVYIDSCCHMNGFGGHLLASAIGKHVVATGLRLPEVDRPVGSGQ